ALPRAAAVAAPGQGPLSRRGRQSATGRPPRGGTAVAAHAVPGTQRHGSTLQGLEAADRRGPPISDDRRGGRLRGALGLVLDPAASTSESQCPIREFLAEEFFRKLLQTYLGARTAAGRGAWLSVPHCGQCRAWPG